ncbi:MAG TPA: hypothetical protein DIV86_01500 [Alphaproteobacteria bacterium]|nr:hypothetical protein [Alphaproteobacteria bacterium]
MKNLVLVTFTLVFLTSCAVQRYGRANSLTDVERKELTCREINIELAKAQEFLDDVKTQRTQTKATHVLGFFADFGIGNAMEGSEAQSSGEKRVSELKSLKETKDCK